MFSFAKFGQRAVRPRAVVGWILLGCAGIFAATAPAQTQSFFFTGAVDEVPDELASHFSVGDVISGSYTFDTTATSSTAGDGSKTYAFSVSNFDMHINGYGLTQAGAVNGDILVGDNVAGRDLYWVVGGFSSGESLDGMEPVLHSFQLEDSSGQALTTDALPLLPVDLSPFDSRLIAIDFSNGAGFSRLSAQLTSLAVPEPAMHILGMLGGLALLASKRRHRR